MRRRPFVVGVFGAASVTGWLADWVGVAAVLLVAAALAYVGRGSRRADHRRRTNVAWQRAFVRMAGSLESGADLLGALRSGAGPSSGDERRAGGRGRSFRPARAGPGAERLLVDTARESLSRAADIAALGGDPSQLLAGQPDRGAQHLAVALAAGDELGLAMRQVLSTLAIAEVERGRVSRDVDLALSTARATIRLLAWLPIAGLFLTVLVDRSAAVQVFAGAGGRACLFAGATLESVGLLWTQRIADRACESGRFEKANLDVALGVDLIAACSAAGGSLGVALRVVGRELAEPVGDRFSDLAARLSLGAGAPGCGEREALSVLGRIVLAGDREGVPPGPALRSLSIQLRSEVAAAQRERAHRVGVSSVLPLGLCFLPAFVLVSVVPVVAAAFGQLDS